MFGLDVAFLIFIPYLVLLVMAIFLVSKLIRLASVLTLFLEQRIAADGRRLAPTEPRPRRTTRPRAPGRERARRPSSAVDRLGRRPDFG